MKNVKTFSAFLNETKLSNDSAETIIDGYIENLLAQKKRVDPKIKAYSALLVKNGFDTYEDIDFDGLSLSDKAKVIKLSWTIWTEDKISNKEQETSTILAAVNSIK